MPHRPPADATERFASRVSNYVKTRPGYPAGVVDVLQARCGLGSATIGADVGAGTGIFTHLLLKAGAGTIHAIEPNRPMRDALVQSLGADPRLVTHHGSAEQTGLADATVDLIVAAQAFHWFDRAATRREFIRILRPCGWVALVWNSRRADTSPFLTAYEQLLHRWSPDYENVNHRNIGLDVIAPFFAPGRVEVHAFPHQQLFDFDGVRGRLLSSSYAPAEGHPNHEPMLHELRALFGTHHSGGRITFDYSTEVYLGRFA